ncbi:MAG: HAD hydrolase family protein [Dehalococcoidales bacterium]|nr:HAD hydrolase family protein [Dehalococcoidales bacterium]
MKLFPGGDKVFEVISRYDDILTIEEKPGYEPGDTLALIVPFLVLHHIIEEDIITMAAKPIFTGGAEKLVSWLQGNSWKVFCITTTYEQYALRLTQKLGIFSQNVACTPFPLNRMHQTLSQTELALLQRVEADILKLYPPNDDAKIKQSLDRFFQVELPATEVGKLITQVKPVGGWRKLEALNRFAERNQQPLSKWIAIGDSITDFRMLHAVDAAGGLAIAFNANQYALPYATMSLASSLLSDLTDVLKAWQKDGRKGAEKIVREKEAAGGSDNRGYFHWLSGRKDINDVIEIHRRARKLAREEASKLG